MGNFWFRLKFSVFPFGFVQPATVLIAMAYFIINVVLLCVLVIFAFYPLEYAYEIGELAPNNTQFADSNARTNTSNVSVAGEIMTDHLILFWISFICILATIPASLLGAYGVCKRIPDIIRIFKYLLLIQYFGSIFVLDYLFRSTLNVYVGHIQIIWHGPELYELNIAILDHFTNALYYGTAPQACSCLVVAVALDHCAMTNLEMLYKMDEGRYRGEGKKLFSIPGCADDDLRFQNLCLQVKQLIEDAFLQESDPLSLFIEYPESNFGKRPRIYYEMIHRCLIQNDEISANSENCTFWDNSEFKEFCLKVLDIVHRETDEGKLSEFISSAGKYKPPFEKMVPQIGDIFRRKEMLWKEYLFANMKLHSSHIYTYIGAFTDNPLCQLLSEYMILVHTLYLYIPGEESFKHDPKRLVDLFLKMDELIDYAIVQGIQVPTSISKINAINKNPKCRGLVLLVAILLYRARSAQSSIPSKLASFIKRVLRPLRHV